MQIVIDMQGVQTESRFRGIGRYTMSFAQAIVRNRGKHEVILALNGLFPDTVESVRAAFDNILSQECIRVWRAPGPVMEGAPGNDGRREEAELIREAFLASLQPDLVHISSLFEGYVDDAVGSIDRLDRTTPVSVMLYDLIPLLNPEQYLDSNPVYAKYYRRKLEYLRRAAVLLAISASAREEGLRALDVSEQLIVNVSTAIEERFRREPETAQDRAMLARRFGVKRPFVLYTGGDDERKNLPRLVEAYAALPAPLREACQLLLAGRMQKTVVDALRRLAAERGLAEDDLVVTGYVSDTELVKLYNLCELFVFPSWHEGFGLPALEAMACGAPTIGANTTSLPEVIGNPEAMFDPLDVRSISGKIEKVLENAVLRESLRQSGLQRSVLFSWDRTAQRAIAAWEELLARRSAGRGAKVRVEKLPLAAAAISAKPRAWRKPRLAFVSPLPPERTGISDYASELIPALAEHYDIDVVVGRPGVTDERVLGIARVRDATWLRMNAADLDRVVYQVGNSPFHSYMLPLLRQVPGTVVLHDFFLSGLVSWLELEGGAGPVWSEALYEEHGYAAVLARLHNSEAAKRDYPVCLSVLAQAKGVIFHSQYARQLVRRFYSPAFSAHSAVIPLLRKPAESPDRAAARLELGIAPDAFVICTFGFLAETKHSRRLLEVCQGSTLAADAHCELMFVGENDGGEYGRQMREAVQRGEMNGRVRITGFVPADVYRRYLAAADVAVQLRTQSRGETSAAALDCMNYGLPLIVNANGSMAELEKSAVWMLPDEFTDAELRQALETLWKAPDRRLALGTRASACVRERNVPAACAQQYAVALEHFATEVRRPLPLLLRAIAESGVRPREEADIKSLAADVALTFPPERPCKRFFLDITATSRHDLKTGIERVTQALLLALLREPLAGWRIEPVYLSQEEGKWQYRRASRYVLAKLGWTGAPVIEDVVVEPDAGEVVVGLDISGDALVEAARAGLFRRIRERGSAVWFMVHDLLPVRMPEVFPPGADISFERWLRTVCSFDGAICVSQAVAKDLVSWREESLSDVLEGRMPFKVAWSHHGADIMNFAPTLGLPENAPQVLRQLRRCPTFLMVGTIEPRKGYGQVLAAFGQLWREGMDVNLVIVGREGWWDLPAESRRDIPQIISNLRDHPERGRRLFWLEGVSDEYLEQVYSAATCLLAASYDEGFGLPLIEAAQHNLPILARDLPVFREVAGAHASYFTANDAVGLARTLRRWLAHTPPIPSTGMPFLTWPQSAQGLLRAVLGEEVRPPQQGNSRAEASVHQVVAMEGS